MITRLCGMLDLRLEISGPIILLYGRAAGAQYEEHLLVTTSSFRI
ncbi:MAG: hypothetical protein ACLSE4_02195 [Clostridium sp.]